MKFCHYFSSSYQEIQCIHSSYYFFLFVCMDRITDLVLDIICPWAKWKSVVGLEFGIELFHKQAGVNIHNQLWSDICGYKITLPFLDWSLTLNMIPVSVCGHKNKNKIKIKIKRSLPTHHPMLWVNQKLKLRDVS